MPADYVKTTCCCTGNERPPKAHGLFKSLVPALWSQQHRKWTLGRVLSDWTYALEEDGGEPPTPLTSYFFGFKCGCAL